MRKALENRRSIRKYKDKEVSVDVIRELIECASLAPSGKNKQPWKFLVYGKQKKNELVSAIEKGLEREINQRAILPDTSFGLPDAQNTLEIMKQAPIIIIVLNVFGESPFKAVSSDKRVTEIVDSLSIGAAVENMLLRAEDMGLGMLWIGNTYFSYPEIEEYICTQCQISCALALGYADERPEKRPRKDFSQICEIYI